MTPIHAFTTTSRQGHVRAPKALARLLKKQRWPAAIAIGQQVHRAKIAIVPRLSTMHEYAGVDGLLTAQAHQPLGIFTADCVPVFLSAQKGAVVGLLHAGWRGVQSGIAAKAIRLVKTKWNIRAHDVQLWAGPSIGPCCFEVQWDVARYFPRSRQRQGKRWRVNLVAALQKQTVALGARWKSTRVPCTMHTKDYFSFRRDATAKRQVSLIMKKGSS